MNIVKRHCFLENTGAGIFHPSVVFTDIIPNVSVFNRRFACSKKKHEVGNAFDKHDH